MHTIISSPSKTVTIGLDQPFCVIGERINPTGRKKFQEQLRAGDLSQIALDVEQQVAGGADVLDVNMGVPLTDEPELMRKAVTLVQSLTDLPLCIDSSVIEALQSGLEAYHGKALVNSITAEDDRCDVILPLIKRHGAAVIGLTNDESGLPMVPAERLAMCEKLMRQCEKHGIPLENLVVDPLCMTVGADPEAGNILFETIQLIRDKYQLNMTIGASNVSFGLPNRHAANAAFLPMAMIKGLTSAVMDARTPGVVTAVRAADLMLGNDPWGGNWIARFRAEQAAAAAAAGA